MKNAAMYVDKAFQRLKNMNVIETERAMKEIGLYLSNKVNKEFGNSFTVFFLAFDANSPDVANFVSNADIDSTIKALKIIIKKLENRQFIEDVKGSA